MGVVELDRDLLGQRAPVALRPAEAPHEVGQRAGDEEILLHEAQALAHVVESSGYSTRVSDSAASVSASAPTKSPRLKRWKSK